MTVREALEQHPFTHDLRPSERATLATLAQVQTWRPGQLLIEDGAASPGLFLLLSGVVDIELHINHFVRRLQTLGPGQTVGWSWAVGPHYSKFDVRAREEVKAVEFPAVPLRILLESEPALGYQFMLKLVAVLAERLHHTRLQVADLY